MRDLRKVLVPLDGSPEAESVLETLGTWTAPRGVIVLMHVLEIPAPSSEEWIPDLLRSESEAERYLEDVASRFPHFRFKSIIETGDAAPRILAAAREEKADALAMAFQPRGRLSALLTGSVSRRVVLGVARPILLVPPKASPPLAPDRQILVPLDGPEEADTVLGTVQVLAGRSGSEVVLLHVQAPPMAADPVTGFSPIVMRPLELPEITWLDPLVDQLEHHQVQAVKRVTIGNPAGVILRESRERKVSLIAIGTHGRGGLARLLLGSVTDQILKRTDRAVLLFHRVGK